MSRRSPPPPFFLFLPPQQSLLRQQERVEERVHEIEEQLCKLDSDKCVVEVGVHLLAPAAACGRSSV